MSAATLTRAQADAQILAAADSLFYPSGVASVTMAHIRDTAGVSLRRLYSLYPSKSDLIGGWLAHRHDEWTAWFQAGIALEVQAGETATDAVFLVLGRWLADTDYRGCGFINTLIEAHQLTDEHRRSIKDHKQQLIEVLAAHTMDPAGLAVLIDGAIVQSAIFASLEPVEAARRIATLLPSRPVPQ